MDEKSDEISNIERMLEVLIRERRMTIWNRIQELYSIPEDVQKSIHRWICCNCLYAPKVSISSPIALAVQHEGT